MTSYELVSLLIQASALVVSTVVLVVLVRQVGLLARQVNDATDQAAAEHVRAQQRETFQYLSRTLLRMHELLMEIPESETEYRKLVASAYRPRSKRHQMLRRYLDYLEDIAAGANLGVFDQATVERILGTRIIRAWYLTFRWIRHEQDRADNSKLFDEVHQLAQTMNASRRERKLPEIVHLMEGEEELADSD